jgi:hypothetical protein
MLIDAKTNAAWVVLKKKEKKLVLPNTVLTLTESAND